MLHYDYALGSYSSATDIVPVPEALKGKDTRADAAARAAVLAATDAIGKMPEIDRWALNVIVLNREGCQSHMEKITEGLSRRTARQGFFARGAPQTLATYTALALGSHGAAFTVVGAEAALNECITTALSMAMREYSSGTLLTVVGHGFAGGFRAKSVLVTARKHDADASAHVPVEQRIHEHLATAFHQET